MKDFLDTSKQEEQTKEAEKLRERELGDIRWVLSAPQGRRFFWRLLARGRLYKSSFTGNSTTFYNEGTRDYGLWLLNEIMEAKPESFIQMHSEFKSELISKEKKDG